MNQHETLLLGHFEASCMFALLMNKLCWHGYVPELYSDPLLFAISCFKTTLPL